METRVVMGSGAAKFPCTSAQSSLMVRVRQLREITAIQSENLAESVDVLRIRVAGRRAQEMKAEGLLIIDTSV